MNNVYEKKLIEAVAQAYDRVNNKLADIKEYQYYTDKLSAEIYSIVSAMPSIDDETILTVLRDAIASKTADLEQREKAMQSLNQELQHYQSQLEFVQHNICPHVENSFYHEDHASQTVLYRCLVCGLVK